MELSKFNPFPLNIKPKIDSWEKLQLLQHIDPQLKLTAAELNRILAALQYLYSNVSVSEYVSNVPVQMRGLAVNFKASGSQLQKVANAINSMPNYVINDGNLIFFYTQRIVNSSISDIKLSLTAVHGVKSYSVITEYYILSRRIPTIGGIASVGIDGTPVSEADLIPLPPRDTRSVPPQEYYLGEIGTAEVSEVVNEGSLLATPRGYTVIFRAKRSGEEVIYLYEGLEAEVGDGAEATSEADFREFPSDEAELDPSPPPSLYLFKDYETIPDMIADIGNQTASDILFVVDASDDPDLDFTGIGKKHAYYRRNYDQADAQLASYLLISAPYAATGGGSSVFENDIVVALPPDHTLGKYSNGDTIPAQGKTFEEVMNDIAQAVINPTFVAPAFGLSSSVSGTREIGTTLDVTLTANFNRGRINGAIVGGVWNPTAKQADRAGAATDYEFQGVSNGTNNVKTINDYLVTSGSNSFSSKVTYAEGAQPKNSVGDDYSTPLPAGNMTANTAFTGALYRFYGAGVETVNPRTLSKLFDTTNINNTFDLPTGTVNNHFHLYIPQNRILEKVELVEASSADITSEYEYLGIVSVPDANGDMHNYRHYRMTTAIPYSSNSTHRIKIKNA